MSFYSLKAIKDICEILFITIIIKKIYQLPLAFTKPILLSSVFAILPNKFKAKALYWMSHAKTLLILK